MAKKKWRDRYKFLCGDPADLPRQMALDRVRFELCAANPDGSVAQKGRWMRLLVEKIERYEANALLVTINTTGIVLPPGMRHGKYTLVFESEFICGDLPAEMFEDEEECVGAGRAGGDDATLA